MNDIIFLTMTIIGHASFVLTFLAFAQKSLIKLRIIAIGSQALGIVYNTWINYNMPDGSDIRLVIFWLTMFFILNVYLLIKEISSSLEIKLTSEDKELLVSSFPIAHSRDWLNFKAAGKTTKFRFGDKMLAVGDATSELSLIVSGQAEEIRDGARKGISRGSMWGELTYVMGEGYFNKSPVDIVVTSAELTLMTWAYKDLAKLSQDNLRFTAALQNGFVHSAGLKHGLLIPKQKDYQGGGNLQLQT